MLGLNKQKKQEFEYFFAKQCVKVVSDEQIDSFEEDVLNKKKIFIKKPSKLVHVENMDFVSINDFVRLYLVFSNKKDLHINSYNQSSEDVFEYLITNDFPDFIIKMLIRLQQSQQKIRNDLEKQMDELKNKFLLPNGKTN